ncbi:GyrI-like domain-containing protein [Vallitalea okinawensis]|uniref:GyrI-like domain-containing protein n=1 Tax=Vallitalea okinawensis TaxID=2078660 RepID=UPI000CFA9629|nr:GyrI-like domain-containing protein [Vallitalea okinawensis]
MDDHIVIKDIDPIRVATMRYKGQFTEAGKHFPQVFKGIKGKSNGAPFFCYHSVDVKTGVADMELCVPTMETPNHGGITVKELPRVRALSITHIGPYDTLPMTYEIIQNYIQENTLVTEIPWREVFIKGPGMLLKGNPNKYITEILFPLKEG